MAKQSTSTARDSAVGSKSQDQSAVMWFRRDLRIGDNPALLQASKRDALYCVFVLDDGLRKSAGAPRLAFLYECLRALNDSLGGKLIVRTGKPEVVLKKLCAEVGATEVFCASENEPYGAKRDEVVSGELSKADVELVQVGSPYAIDPGFIVRDNGAHYKVFTPYFQQWSQIDKGEPVSAPSLKNLQKAPSEKIPPPQKTNCNLPQAGEEAALKRLNEFINKDLNNYSTSRDYPGQDSTTRLSPYLKFGCIHPRSVIAELHSSRSTVGAQSLVRELCFREFYADSIFNTPELTEKTLDVRLKKLKQDTGKQADERFDAWTQGRTGYPIVDAGMRQLLAEGFIHNRVRMIVGSFLVKDLHIDWQRGAEWFMQNLVDGDVCNNTCGWQWVAGSGPGAQPFFRIFNPITQSEKFDKTGEYIRTFVPELRELGAKQIHAPWLSNGGVPDGYCEPIVDHKKERDDALARFAATATA